jgi:hypothetical protein
MFTGSHVIIYSGDAEADRGLFGMCSGFRTWTPGVGG